MADYSRVNWDEVEDSAAKHGFGELQDARFPREALGLDTSGLARMHVRPGKRQPFAHRHARAEEVHLIVAGGGRMKLDDDEIKVGAGDVIRVGPNTGRAFEAGPEGLEYFVFSPREEGDAEIIEDFWD